MLPFVPGSYVGKAAKVVGKLDDVADICKTAKRVGNVVDTVDDVVDTAKAIKKTASTANKISDLSKAAKKTVDATLSTAKKAAQDATSQFKKLANQTQKAVAELQEKASKAAKKVDVNVGTGFNDWLNKGAADNKVYFGVSKDDRYVYTGITKQSTDARL